MYFPIMLKWSFFFPSYCQTIFPVSYYNKIWFFDYIFQLLIQLINLRGNVVHTIKGDTCQEGLGQCGASNDCDLQCKTRHAGQGQGSCDRTIQPPLCTCFYPCGSPSKRPPSPKKCTAGLGACDQCRDLCCNGKCAAQFKGGQGFCDNIGAQYLCQCTYDC